MAQPVNMFTIETVMWAVSYAKGFVSELGHTVFFFFFFFFFFNFFFYSNGYKKI